MSKIFVIGFNKTATSTFHKLFLKNNLKSQHDTVWQINNFDCFSDNGDLNNFKKLDMDYPNSIFILNTRSLNKWLISRFQHGITEKWSNGLETNWAYPCTSQLCKSWINYRETYYLDILNYFKKKPDKLIIVNIEKDNWLQFISLNLDFKVHNVDAENVSNKNKNTEEYKNILNVVNNTFTEISYDDKERKNILFRDPVIIKPYLKMYKNNIL
jgi:hypothetical protein